MLLHDHLSLSPALALIQPAALSSLHLLSTSLCSYITQLAGGVMLCCSLPPAYPKAQYFFCFSPPLRIFLLVVCLHLLLHHTLCTSSPLLYPPAMAHLCPLHLRPGAAGVTAAAQCGAVLPAADAAAADQQRAVPEPGSRAAGKSTQVCVHVCAMSREEICR